MDHLSQVADALRPHVEVPYIVRSEDVYDYSGLQGVGEKFHCCERTRDEILSFLQSWCFFGLVTEVLRVLGVTVTARDFITTSQNGQQYLTTRRLPSCLLTWAAIEMIQPKEIKDSHRQEVQSLLSAVSLFLLDLLGEEGKNWPEGYMEQGGSDDGTPHIHCSVLLSIAVLGESLSHSFEMIYTGYGPEPVYWPHCWFLEDLLLRAGWCKFEINLLRSRYHVGNTGLYYMSPIDPRLIGKDHTGCSEEFCVTDNVNVEEYQTKHTLDLCHCRDIIGDSDIHQITQIVLRGQLPLYTVTEDERGNCIVSVRAFKSGFSLGKTAPYVAVSHVWADGLGNIGRNSLPKCQLLRLQKLCDALYELESKSKYRPIPFWIDTLCVPVKKGRQEAIAMLALTFKEADKVLALDKSLMHTSVNVEMQEALMKILCSSWARRLWTFQEGAFSKSLHFQFRDGSIHGHEGYLLNRRIIEVGPRIKQGYESAAELADRRIFLSQSARELWARGNFLSQSTRDSVWAKNYLTRIAVGFDDVFVGALL